MKKILSYIALFVFLLSVFNFPTAADSKIPVWSSSQEAKSVTLVHNGGQVIYRYTPTKTGEYAVKVPEDVPISLWVDVKNGDKVIKEFEYYSDAIHEYHIFKLGAGTEYTVIFELAPTAPGGMGKPGASYTCDISIIKWNNELANPNLPYVTEGKANSVRVAPEANGYTEFLFVPYTSKTYRFAVSNKIQKVEVTIAKKTITGDGGPNPTLIDTWESGSLHGSQYSLDAGRIYNVRLYYSGSTPATDTLYIYDNNSPSKVYEELKVGTIKTIKAKEGGEIYYYITPNETGKHMVYANSETIEVFNQDGYSMLLSEFSARDYASGYIFELAAGERYLVRYSGNNSISHRFKFEKVGEVKSASIFPTDHSNSDKSCFLGIDVNPICGGYYKEGVKWSVSDPSVAVIKESGNSGAEIKFLKNGKVTVTAKVGKVTASYELKTNTEPPVLKEGKTTDVWCGFRNCGIVADIKPTKSGKYQFTVIPKKLHENHQPHIAFTVGYHMDYDSLHGVYDTSEKQVFTVKLKAGNNYYVAGSHMGRYSVLYEYVGPASFTDDEHVVNDNDDEGGYNADYDDDEGDSSSKEDSGDKDDSPSSDIDKPNEDDGYVQVIPFTPTKTKKVIIGAPALREAAESGSKISMTFPDDDIVIELDNSIVSSLSDSAANDGVSVSAEVLKPSSLNEKQQKALEGKEPQQILDLTMTLDGEQIHSLGGTAQVSVPNPDKNKEWEVLYLAEDGTAEKMEVTCGDSITFYTEHFSQYALVSSGAKVQPQNVGWIILVVLAVVLLAGGSVLFLVLKKKKA